MDFGNYGGGVCEAAASDPSSATVANLLSSSGGGASNGAGLGVPAFTKSTVSRSAVPEPDFGKPRTQDDRSADGSVLKIPFELRQQQQNHHSGGSGNSSSDGSAQQLQLLGRAHNSGGAAGIVGDVVSPWAVHALLQHQSYSPFRASAGMPPLPMAMTPSVMGVNGGGGTAGAMNVQRGGSYCFTPMQWQELEHQALIYKYILAEQPVPPELLIPIKRSLAGAADYLHHQPNLVGWNSFQMRFANVKADAEPGRCRRTDGKKWRCSRDAAPDQKYCERHMHRGRPRSRKPVEGGHTAAINGGGGNSSSNNNNSNNTSVSTSAATSSSASATAAAQSLNNNNSSIIGGNPASSCNGSSSPSSFGSLASVSRSSVSSSVRPAATTDSSRAAAAAAADQFLNLKSLTTAAASTASINGGLSHFKSPLNMVKDYRYMNWMKGDNGNVSSSSEDHQLLLSDTHGSSKSHHHHHHHNHHHHHLSNNSGSSNSNSCTTTDAQTHHQNQNQHIVAAAAAAAAAASNLNPAAAAAAAANNWRCWGPPSTKLNMSSSAAQHAMLQQYSRSLMGSSSSHSHNINHHSCNLSDFSVLQDQQNLSHHSSNNNNTQSLFLTDTQQPLRHFIDDWGAAAAAAAEEHSRSTATQLSMSSMAASTDLGLGLMNNNNSTTTNTNTNDRHSHHSTNNNNNHRSSSSNSYVPVALGGPLAEVLQHNSAAPVNPAAAAVAAGLCRSGTTAVKASAGALNLLSNEVWELSSTSPQESPRMASSPTGVLQKTLASLSDSSSGSTAAAAVKHDTLHNLASV